MKVQLQMNTFYLQLIRTIAIPFLLTISYPAYSAEDEHLDAEEEHNESTEISAELAQELGIKTQIAAGGEINRLLLLYGKAMPDPQQVSHVAARYPGMIRNIVPALGETVEAGQIIATIEANSSLQEYQILAPLSGTVVEKHANPGELATDQPLLTIANYNNIWIDLTVFPGDSQWIVPDLPVTITMDNLSTVSKIRYLNPSQGDSPTVIARVPISNPDGRWTPGLLVEARVEVERVIVDMIVNNDALQIFEGNQVVFVKDGNTYTPRQLSLGRSDGNSTEVIMGLEPGEYYVVTNSYLIKADLEKEGTEHGH
tara:strand:+ start:1729 stop:2667 length:939 start_codon:yes stop_codon:yes gene_type:complete